MTFGSPLADFAALAVFFGAAYLVGLAILRLGLWFACAIGWWRGEPGDEL